VRLDGSASPRDGRFARRLFRDLPARYDRLAEWLSFGQNRRWRRAMVDPVVAARPRLVLDVATGTAGVARQLAQRSGARVVGVDLTEAMLGQGRRNVADAGLSRRVDLVVGSAERLPFPDATFDALTFTYLLRYVGDPAATVRELARVVKPGGVVAFDVVTDPCLDDRTAQLWAEVGTVHHMMSRDWVLQYLGRRGLELAGSHFTPLPPGTAELLVFRRR